jgi:phosphoglycerate kinase
MVKYVRDKAAGLLMMKEVEILTGIMEKPARPFVALLGGAKVSDKVAVLDSLVKKADAILVGGAMAYTLMAASGKKTGNSRVEHDKIGVAEDIVRAASSRGVPLLLPVDAVAPRFDEAPRHGGQRIGVRWASTSGPRPSSYSRRRWPRLRRSSERTDGRLGGRPAAGTMAMAQAVAGAKAVTVVGGGDSVAALNQSGLEAKITHVSTGGGASLELIEGKVLPGVKALEE